MLSVLPHSNNWVIDSILAFTIFIDMKGKKKAKHREATESFCLLVHSPDGLRGQDGAEARDCHVSPSHACQQGVGI